MNTPRVSVILPVYNGAPWVAGAIQCVLDQTCTDFELLIVDDGSKDDSWAVISHFDDPRIRACRQENRGLAATLNRLIEMAGAPYVARQDQDDWMHPQRLEKQLKFMDESPDCAAVGTWAEIRVDDCPSGRRHCHPIGSDALKIFLLFDNPFVHSSMLLRKAALQEVGGYSENKSRQPPEDYELWSRVARRFSVANIPEELTAYREVAGSMSRTGPNPFLQKVMTISAENLDAALAGKYSREDCVLLAALYHGVIVDEGRRLRPWKALAMLHDAAVGLTQGRVLQPGEANSIYLAVRYQIRARLLQRYLPARVLALGRKLKNLLEPA